MTGYATALEDFTRVLEVAQEPDAIIVETLRILATSLNSSSVCYFRYSPLGHFQLGFGYVDGRLLGPSELVALDPRAPHRLSRQLAEGLAQAVHGLGGWDSTRASVVENVDSPLASDFAKWRLAHGWVSDLYVPCSSRGVTLGMYLVGRGLSTGYTSEEILFGQILGRQGALAVLCLSLTVEVHTSREALERERLAQERARALETVNDLIAGSVQRLASLGSLDSYLATTLKLVAEHTGAVTAHLLEYKPSRNLLISRMAVRLGELFVPHHPLDPPEFVVGFDADINPQFQQLVGIAGLLRIDDESSSQHAWPFATGWHQAMGHLKCAGIALVGGGEPVGFLGLAFDHAHSLSDLQRELARTLANQMALAMQITRLAEEAQAIAVVRERESAAQVRAQELARANRTIQETVDALAAAPVIEHTLGHVLAVLSDYLESSSSALWVKSSDQACFQLSLVYLQGRVLIAQPGTDGLLLGQWLRERDVEFSQHMELRRVLVYQVDDLSRVSPEQRAFLVSQGIETLLGVPLTLGQEVIGNFTVRFSHRRVFSPEDLELVQAVAHQGALALRLVQLGDAASQAAVFGERARLAREIHDTVAQGLVGILLQARGAILEPQAAADRLLLIERLALEGLLEARRAVQALRGGSGPPFKTAERFRSELNKLAKSFGAELWISVGDPLPDFDAAVEGEFLRIAQEALVNAIKHSGQTQVCVDLASADGGIRLCVSDFGLGFDPAVLPAGGFGLIGMQERADRIGALFQLISEPGRGTRVVLTWRRHKTQEAII